MQFITKNSVPINTLISWNNNDIVEASHLKFLGLEIDNALSWTIHTDSVINKLTSVCFMIRSVTSYYVLFIAAKDLLFSVSLSYGIIFWGQATNTKKLYFDTKKKLFV
jgi:hypothetical protein